MTIGEDAPRNRDGAPAAALAVAIRQAVPADAAALTALALASKASNGYDAAFMAACRDELAVTPALIMERATWVAEQAPMTDGAAPAADPQIAGYVSFVIEDGCAEIMGMFVDPASKRAGIGQVLWACLEREAAACGCQAITCDADPFAVPFYQAMGMAVTGAAPSGSIAGRMLPRMEKSLLGA